MSSSLSSLRRVTPDDVGGRRVLTRVDFNAPLGDGGEVRDVSRLRAAVPGLLEMADAGARLILISHLAPDDAGLASVARAFGGLLPSGRKFSFCADLLGDAAREAVRGLGDGEILLLENLRHHSGERGCDHEFVKALAGHGEIFVNDAFSVCHRAHGSVVGLPRRLTSFAGSLLARECAMLGEFVSPGAEVFEGSFALVGGAKISTKMPLLESLSRRFSVLAVGGGIANTLLAAGGARLGDSLVEADALDAARILLEVFGGDGARLMLPEDFVVRGRDGVTREVLRGEVEAEGLGDGEAIFDVGVRSIEAIGRVVGESGLCVWNGPFGFFEEEVFARGSCGVAGLLAGRGEECDVVVGGGETAAVVGLAGFGADDFSHLSMAGGAFLAWLEGVLPVGVRALMTAPEFGGPRGADPTRYGDWERAGRAVDF
ncbi:MAG: phosphoglycerate kinase [Alphaproteobacteria bacterium]|nr:phosphoglycerate kinase [Alphaproteobacteria bacterium]MDA8006461.1 phosphoglycerate kinase [Alphaproteobacteria bacterium]MDA8013870.1 phosphoglycerate kinase [Alphaproteobacteria bacterium]